jgi:acyl-coenzyme A synthetase/AMP-(fatty) acid ligase
LDQEGNYILIGRRDHMIKSRGYRIELGEIETALYANPHIKEAAAVPIPDEEFGNRIKACVVLEPPGSLTESEIKKFCADRLPSYMVPEFVSVYAALPRTSTGKVDRKDLASRTDHQP